MDEHLRDAFGTGFTAIARIRRRAAPPSGPHAPAAQARWPCRGPPGGAACSEPPDGRDRWTLERLTERFVALGAVRRPLMGPCAGS
jgi:hypothetical protein